ncbi:hypothetical protein BDN72DRAFT_301140 [Pluteus cervinus]|uniref:Uncharacterized protein n=1 Tax=Pluteus cervinus TaxID=181527 RepID=A0ACD3ADL7_9AGAR|nr:hypothetical protein BDN72DRAFT_301140 [Pluteus cervinus]
MVFPRVTYRPNTKGIATLRAFVYFGRSVAPRSHAQVGHFTISGEVRSEFPQFKKQRWSLLSLH